MVGKAKHEQYIRSVDRQTDRQLISECDDKVSVAAGLSCESRNCAQYVQKNRMYIKVHEGLAGCVLSYTLRRRNTGMSMYKCHGRGNKCKLTEPSLTIRMTS